MNKKVLDVVFSIVILSATFISGKVHAWEAGPGPFYFVSDEINPVQHFWREPQWFAGKKVHLNYNLLAAVLGDDPYSLPPTIGNLVPSRNYRFSDTKNVDLQPFAWSRDDGPAINHGVPTNLKRFLDDPLTGAEFDLSLPFSDPEVALSDKSASMRIRFWQNANGQLIFPSMGDSRIWHGGIDFDHNLSTKMPFEVLAPADGVIHRLRKGKNGQAALVILHTASNGNQFMTIYQHLDNDSIDSWITPGRFIERGASIAKTWANGIDYSHLHFGVAVRAEGATIYPGRPNEFAVPPAWYLIDPLGVYDYRRLGENYLPSNRLDSVIKKRRHAQVFKNDNLIKAIQ